MRATMPRTMGRQAIWTALWSAVVSAVMFLLMFYVAGPRLPVSAVDVPPLHGLSPEQARGLLEPRGLLLVLDQERADATVPPGTILAQQPLGGSRLRRGDEVHAQLARAVKAVRVPNVAGLLPDAARDLLAQNHLKVGRTTEAPSDTVPHGQVASATPAIGTDAPPDAPIDLVVSSGPSTQPVPSLVGKHLSSARKLLQQAGFVVGATRYGSNDDYDQGIVIGQNPTAGSQASPGVKIDLVIND